MGRKRGAGEDETDKPNTRSSKKRKIEEEEEEEEEDKKQEETNKSKGKERGKDKKRKNAKKEKRDKKEPTNTTAQQHNDQKEADADSASKTGSSSNGHTTLRQQRRAMKTSPGADGREQGEVQQHPQRGLLWLDEQGNSVEAVYHNDIRRQLLDQASNNGQKSYDEPRQRGEDVDDETAFLETQRNWRSAREYWGNIGNGVLHRLERGNLPTPRGDAGTMWYNGRIVLDLDSHPVRDFDNIPPTLSSQAEGWLMEAISRLDPRIEKTDFRARMPSHVLHKNGRDQRVLFGLSAIGNRQARFRERNGLIAWNERSGTSEMVKLRKSKMTPEQLANNSTEDAPGITKKELEDLRERNRGEDGRRFLSRAGTSLLSEIEREDRQDKENRRKRKKASRAAHATKPKRKRPAPAYSESEDEEDFPNKKRKYDPLPTTRVTRSATRKADPSPPNHQETFLATGGPLETPMQEGLRTDSSEPEDNEDPPIRDETPPLVSTEPGSQSDAENDEGVPEEDSEDSEGVPEEDSEDNEGVFERDSEDGDLRFIAPETAEAQIEVDRALEYTRQDYLGLTDVPLPRTSFTESYAVQYGELQAHLQQNWNLATALPNLLHLERWEGDFSDWIEVRLAPNTQDFAREFWDPAWMVFERVSIVVGNQENEAAPDAEAEDDQDGQVEDEAEGDQDSEAEAEPEADAEDAQESQVDYQYNYEEEFDLGI